MEPLTEKKLKEMEIMATRLREDVIKMVSHAGSGHIAGALDMADVFTYLYFHALKHEPKNPDWPYRDIVVLSNGHICPVLYATMAHAGYFPVKELMTLRKLGSRLQGHPHRDWLPQLETSSGPLGCGLSQAVGMAIADRMDNGVSSSKKIVCLMSDGELDEGNSWEAIALAGKEKLQNLTVILDRNNIQIDGFTETILPLEPLPEKWVDFNWHVQEVSGHDFRALDTAWNQAQAMSGRPSVIIAHTIPSKGIPEFERKWQWHGKVPTTPLEIDEARRALGEIRTLGGKVRSEHQ